MRTMADRTIRHIEHTRRIDILSEQELEDIREASLEVLERTGIEVRSERMLTATVKGDLHDLGKNMVGAMLKTVGFEVHDLGKDVPTEKIIDAVKELNPAIVGLSALLTTTVPQQKVVIEALEAEGLRDKVKVMVGGAPVTEEWATSIGADGFAPDAPEAVQKALELAGLAADEAEAVLGSV